jgi:hypothetical protein
MTPDDAVALREPFPADVIEYKHMFNRDVPYINHARVTDRLIAVDPCWTWEPMSVDERGAPKADVHGGFWIRLTILGVTRIGYGCPELQQAKGGDAIKSAISDAIKNAAMRFGVALDLWGGGESLPEPTLAVVRSFTPEPSADDPWSLPVAEEGHDNFATRCEHGERVFRKAKDDKWAAYFCPARVDGCQPQDARTGLPWPRK